MSALVQCRAGPTDQVVAVTVAATAEGQDDHLEVHDQEDENAAEMIIAVVHALIAEDVEGREVEVMIHDIRVDEERSTRNRESQAVMAADPEIERT